jgi:hypothetical protein
MLDDSEVRRSSASPASLYNIFTLTAIREYLIGLNSNLLNAFKIVIVDTSPEHAFNFRAILSSLFYAGLQNGLRVIATGEIYAWREFGE